MLGTKRGSRRTGASFGKRTFDVRCGCGERLHGSRRDEAQVLTCPSCGGSVFVFSESPLPKPKRAENPVVAAEEVASAPSPRARRRWKARSRIVQRRVSRRAAQVFSLRRYFTVPVLICLFVVLTVSVTVGYQLSAKANRRRALEAEESGRAGMAALARGDVVEARRQLESAAERLDGQPDSMVPGSTQILQAADETAILVNLLAEPLSGLLTEAATNEGLGSRRLKGRGLVLDVALDSDDAGGIAPVIAGFIGEEPVWVAVGALEVIQQVRRPLPKRILVGAEMVGLERRESGWWLLLDAGSGVWMTHPAGLKYLGIEDAESVALAAAQRERLGLPDWRDTR